MDRHTGKAKEDKMEIDSDDDCEFDFSFSFPFKFLKNVKNDVTTPTNLLNFCV